MSTLDAAAAHARQVRGAGVKSREARRTALTLLDAPRDLRRQWLHTLPVRDRTYIFGEVARETGTMYGLWHDAPLGFIEDVLGETMWGLQAAVVEAMAADGVKRIAVPAGFGPGKTYLAGRVVAWAVATNPIGNCTVVTTAPKLRMVRSQMWPHIKTAVAKGRLPGRTDTVQWIARDQYGQDKQVAFGFSAAPNDEAAMQGIHGNPKLVLIVDEAGGMSPLLGKATNNLLTGDARLLAIGNPAMNEPGSWFEGLCAKGDDPEEPATVTIKISALDSPAITGAPTPVCRACNPNRDGHTIAEGVGGKSHLPDREWLNDTLIDYGVIIEPGEEDLGRIRTAIRAAGHPYLIAKVLAEFPRNTGNQVMPSSWVEAAELADEPLDHGACPIDAPCHGGADASEVCTAVTLLPGYHRLCDLGLDDETSEFAVKDGAFVRLGVDVASDGGDEFAIYRAIGDVIHQVHVSSGTQNADPALVAEKVLAEIDRAQRLADRLGSPRPVRVKIDKNGLGWGVVGNLERWRQMGRHRADIVGVMVSENPEKVDESAVMRPYRKRDEMWLAGRFLLQPNPSTGFGQLRLRVDHQCKVQLSLPQLGNNSTGAVVVESKASMKKRGLSSPDRAEGALLAIYEPYDLAAPKSKGILTPHSMQVGLQQGGVEGGLRGAFANQWTVGRP